VSVVRPPEGAEGQEAAPPVTLDRARTLLAGLRPRIASFVAQRADLAELRADLGGGRASPLGGMPERKGLEARLHADLERVIAAGAQVRGVAPLLLDWPGERDGTPVWWCWLEGEDDIDWYHRRDCGFPGRRRL
jgi:hypothetical protein